MCMQIVSFGDELVLVGKTRYILKSSVFFFFLIKSSSRPQGYVIQHSHGLHELKKKIGKELLGKC